MNCRNRIASYKGGDRRLLDKVSELKPIKSKDKNPISIVQNIYLNFKCLHKSQTTTILWLPLPQTPTSLED